MLPSLLILTDGSSHPWGWGPCGPGVAAHILSNRRVWLQAWLCEWASVQPAGTLAAQAWPAGQCEEQEGEGAGRPGLVPGSARKWWLVC